MNSDDEVRAGATEVRSVLVVGAGAIGGLLACRLAMDPRLTVTVAARTPLDTLTLRTAEGISTPPVDVVVDPSEVSPPDWVVLATKIYDTDAALAWLRAAVGPRTMVAVAQNGIDHARRVDSVVGPDRVAPLIVSYGAERAGPGRIVETYAGVVKVPDSAAGRAFAALAEAAPLPVEVAEDFDATLWGKLATNLVANSLCTLADVTVRELGRTPSLRRMTERLVAECRTVGAARGVVVPEGLEAVLLESFADCPPEVHPSMWQDLRAGRPLEHRSISGAVRDVAEEQGLAAPYSIALTELLDALSPPRASAAT